ncbi:hypothetical protein EHM69_09995 [candidate division KSB1 bacterium]|nr:MAG: hypothetical protein EHM69_09995 [candidate division KSB1 bacterium]
MRREILRVEPWSAVRIGFVIGLFGGVIFGLLESFIFRMMAGSGSASLLPPEAKGLTELSGGMMIVAALVAGLVFSLICAMIGGLTAMFYNLGARLFGGIEVTDNIPSLPAPSNETRVEDENDV